MKILYVPLDHIDPNPWQTRVGDPDQEYIKELAMDILSNELLQRPMGRLLVAGEHGPDEARDALYEFDNWDSLSMMESGVFVQLAFGHNRLAAYRWLVGVKDEDYNITQCYDTIPVEIRPLTDQQMADYAWSENERRRDVNPLERAIAIQKRMQSFSWNQAKAAEHLALSRSAVSNILRLLDLPDDVRDNVLAGNISERSALALLPLYDLSNAIVKKAEESNYYTCKPSEIIAKAMSGASSDDIRYAIDKLIDVQSKDLQKENFLDTKFDIAGYIVSETCRDCKWRIKARNRCTDPQCFYAKRNAYKSEAVNRASKELGIKPFEEIEFNYVGHTEFRYGSTKEEVEKVIRSGCENLRIGWYEMLNSASPCAVEGEPNLMIFCTKNQCSCLQGAKKSEPQVETSDAENSDSETVCAQTYTSPTAEQLQEIAKRAKKQEREDAKLAEKLKEEAVELLVAGLRKQDPKSMRLILDQLYRGTNWSARPDNIETIYEWIAKSIIQDVFGFTPGTQLRNRLDRWIAENGLDNEMKRAKS